MANECRLIDGAGKTIWVGSREEAVCVLSCLFPDGEYAITGTDIDVSLVRAGGRLHLLGGHVGGVSISRGAPYGLLTESVTAGRPGQQVTNPQKTGAGVGCEAKTVNEPEEIRGVAPPANKKELLFAKLRQAGIATVVVEYDGYGDEGCVNELNAIREGTAVNLAADLRRQVEDYVYERLPRGWEIEDGSYGEIEFDVQAGVVKFGHNRRYTEVSTHEWEE